VLSRNWNDNHVRLKDSMIGMLTEPVSSRRGLSSRALFAIGFGVVYGSALYVFLTFAMATNGLEFFFFYPREAQTILEPFDLLAILWVLAGGFSIFGLVALGLRADRGGKGVPRRQLLVVILGASIAVILLFFESVYLGYSVPFWWIGTIAVGLCWFGFGDGIIRMVGGRGRLVQSFFASLLGIEQSSRSVASVIGFTSRWRLPPCLGKQGPISK
jgi:hypothetical protein